ncbi:MAG: aminotransferase class V-fold PLP-dependent enzyme, partial [Vibrio sp.]
IAEQTGAKVIKVPMNSRGEWDMLSFDALLSNKTKIVTCAHITNVTGYRLPIEVIIKKTHQAGAICVIDGAQGIVHESVDVTALNCDFYVFSAHKIYGPSGIGVLYGKPELLEQMPPYHGGGKMVAKVSFSGTQFAPLPSKFEAGTPNMSGVIGLGAALDWFNRIGYDKQAEHIHTLYQSLEKQLSQIPSVKLIFPQPQASVLSFVCVDDDGETIHPNDVASLLDQQGIAVRAGHHCAHPFMDALGIEGTIRVSLALYNQPSDIEQLIKALKKSLEILA